MKLKSDIQYSKFMYKRRIILCSFLLVGLIGGCATGGKNMTGAETTCLANHKSEAQDLPPEAFENSDDVLTVNCLLPGIPIQIGRYQQYMSRPRPAIISAWECQVQGCRYARTSDADGRNLALNVWRQCANEGDKVAQNYMGEIYGKSWRQIRPDHVRAAEWYRKAAEQGYSRAQNNLGFLYENGLGVAKDEALALKYYRKAMGAVAPIKLDETTRGEIKVLESKLDQAMQTIEDLDEQLRESNRNGMCQ